MLTNFIESIIWRAILQVQCCLLKCATNVIVRDPVTATMLVVYVCVSFFNISSMIAVRLPLHRPVYAIFPSIPCITYLIFVIAKV